MGTSGRRTFLKSVAGAGALPQVAAGQSLPAEAEPPKPQAAMRPPGVSYPRTFTGKHLAMIAFPLGGVGAGSVSLGGRGQLRDWEIFNKPDKGNLLSYAIPSIWVDAGQGKSVARVLESRYLPPYEGQNGLGSANVPGLPRLAGAKFTGEYPLARIDFLDRSLKVRIALEAFTPFVPHDADDSGLPVAVLRYRVRNPLEVPATVSIAWSIDNPVGAALVSGAASQRPSDGRTNRFAEAGALRGIVMSNPRLDPSHESSGSFALCLMDAGGGEVTWLRGWPRGRWWNSPMLFWDDFSSDGRLGPEAEAMNSVGALCLTRRLAAGREAEYAFLLAWHFPNRTPERCGWRAPKGEEKTIIGNYYATRFQDAWQAAVYAHANLARLEKKTRLFAQRLRETTIPAAVKEAASANLSTLATTTCFRTSDGEFHGFEGVNDKAGCCYGNCTHVWNYETATAHLFPSLSRSLRKAAFGFPLDEAGAIHFRQLLPDGKQRSGFAAADGQMGQILHAYLDWVLSGDVEWLRSMWPRIRKALEFSWAPGGWDADRDGVMEGVQHNTYDVEFYGPNPQCGIFYLGALRACEEMARVAGEPGAASEYRRLFENGRRWIDAHLFNGEYYVQKIRGLPKERIAPALMSTMGSENTLEPEYQVGEGCLVDQLVGQYLAEVCGLGALVEESHIRTTLESLYRYNYKRNLLEHESVQRVFAVNEEAALVICDYGKAPRPRIPFPYYAEVMTGFEYAAAAHMMFAGMVSEGVECTANVRARYDGERRNPWDEAECGHHYARAMAAWSGLLALAGFRYHGGERRVTAAPRVRSANFTGFWSGATAWGVFAISPQSFRLTADSGTLAVRTLELAVGPGSGRVRLEGAAVGHTTERRARRSLVRLAEEVSVREGETLTFELA